MMLQNKKIGFGTAAIGRPQYINLRQEAAEEFTPEGWFLKHYMKSRNAAAAPQHAAFDDFTKQPRTRKPGPLKSTRLY